jgi:beta-glucosidase
MAYLPGQEGGRAISDVLFGNINPSGKLPYTYPMYSGNAVTYYHKKTDIRDVNWGYDGFYTQFNFGFGLSYTNFKYENLKINKDTIIGKENLKISIDVKNIGKREGKETVQVYLKDIVATVSPDSKKLVGFNKILLQPNEVKTVEFILSSKDFENVGIDNKWIVEDGDFEVQVGPNSKDVLKQKVYYKNSNNK